jgi:signal transduction histidine kinase
MRPVSDGTPPRLTTFRRVPLFAGLSDDDLTRICSESTDVRLAPGEVLFREGEPGDHAFVVAAGQVEVLKATGSRDALLAVRSEGDVIGEMALLEQAPRSATVRARSEAELVSIPRAALDELLTTSPAAARAVFELLTRRVRETHDQVRHQQRMAQLGVMTAGVAHELNNPAAAVQRAAGQLADQVDRLVAATGRAADDPVLRLLGALADREPRSLDALDASDEEMRVEDWLESRAVSDAGQLAPDLVAAGVSVDDLVALGGDAADGVRLLAAAASLRQLAREVAVGSGRLSEIVGALRSFTYLDRGSLQEVDVLRGLEDTLALLGRATVGVRVVRELAPDLPVITAMGAELNQVWTNLVQNACHALAGASDPTLTLRAFEEGGGVVVEVEDDGPGIPAELQERIFDAFVTTKAPGEGTGLGLQISYRIVVLEHGGELTVRSEPGRTTFRVWLPPYPPTAAPDGENGVA